MNYKEAIAMKGVKYESFQVVKYEGNDVVNCVTFIYRCSIINVYWINDNSAPSLGLVGVEELGELLEIHVNGSNFEEIMLKAKSIIDRYMD